MTALVAGLGGCALHGNAAVANAERGAPPAAAVSDDGFAAAVHDLLLSPPGTPERAMRLGAVEARQMARANLRFKAHAVDRGLAAVSGGLYLVRTREAVRGIFGTAGPEAIQSAGRELSLRGDEGRVRALYDVALQLGPDADIQRHLAALDVWMRDAVAVGGEVESAGALERVAVRRRLLEPSDAALADAAKVTSEWIARAVVLRDKFSKTRVQPQREEGAEAWRALETGPVVLASIYLRDANVTGAVAALDRAQAHKILVAERPQFAAALSAAAADEDLARLSAIRRIDGAGDARVAQVERREQIGPAGAPTRASALLFTLGRRLVLVNLSRRTTACAIQSLVAFAASASAASLQLEQPPRRTATCSSGRRLDLAPDRQAMRIQHISAAR